MRNEACEAAPSHPQSSDPQSPAHRVASREFCRRRDTDKNQKDPLSRGAWPVAQLGGGEGAPLQCAVQFNSTTRGIEPRPMATQIEDKKNEASFQKTRNDFGVPS